MRPSPPRPMPHSGVCRPPPQRLRHRTLVADELATVLTTAFAHLGLEIPDATTTEAIAAKHGLLP
ncbi:hypothetical protein ACIBO2_21865 [Nonomuraea sp. NPDC050022]|uniref:hypothetical protein n=1 Tax=Nonomuraea sp. NPDC050022 TaxID=3364358 RepID=UPI00379E21B4